MVWAILKVLCRKDDVLSHAMCDLVNNENDIDKYSKIIDYYETAKKLFTTKNIFIREKIRENEVS